MSPGGGPHPALTGGGRLAIVAEPQADQGERRSRRRWQGEDARADDCKACRGGRLGAVDGVDEGGAVEVDLVDQALPQFLGHPDRRRVGRPD